MAINDRVTSAARYILEGDVARNRPNSEAINTKIAGSVNILLDRIFYPHQDQWNGYLTTENVGYAATFRVPNDVEISYYEFNVYDVGTAGSTQIQYLVYDNVGAFVGNLFTTRPSIGAGAQFNTVIGRDVEGATSFDTNTTGITFNVGVLSITTLLAGYVLRPVINNFATASKGARFLMRLKEI